MKTFKHPLRWVIPERANFVLQILHLLFSQKYKVKVRVDFYKKIAKNLQIQKCNHIKSLFLVLQYSTIYLKNWSFTRKDLFLYMDLIPCTVQRCLNFSTTLTQTVNLYFWKKWRPLNFEIYMVEHSYYWYVSKIHFAVRSLKFGKIKFNI